MPTLPSGLPDTVSDEEDLARFLTSSGHYNAQIVKPSAFLPSPKHQNTSVFRHGKEPLQDLKDLGEKYIQTERRIHGVGVLRARDVRSAKLDVVSKEPPPKHANIEGWPWFENDPELQRAQQKERASLMSQKAELLIFEGP